MCFSERENFSSLNWFYYNVSLNSIITNTNNWWYFLADITLWGKQFYGHLCLSYKWFWKSYYDKNELSVNNRRELLTRALAVSEWWYESETFLDWYVRDEFKRKLQLIQHRLTRFHSHCNKIIFVMQILYQTQSIDINQAVHLKFCIILA